MAAAGREPARFVCVTRFGSHQCGCVLQRGGRGVRGRGSLGLGCSPERPRGAAAGAAGGGALRPVPEPGVPAGPSAAPASSARSGPGRAARAGGAIGTDGRAGRGGSPSLSSAAAPGVGRSGCGRPARAGDRGDRPVTHLRRVPEGPRSTWESFAISLRPSPRGEVTGGAARLPRVRGPWFPVRMR